MRRRAAAAAAVLLGVLLLARNRPAEILRRVRFLDRTASAEPDRRRLAGSSAAFDRPYVAFLVSVRRSIPAGAAGVALFLPERSEPALYLAAYEMAPVPVALVSTPEPAAPGWIGAVYGAARPAGWTVIRELPGGALLAPGTAAPR